MNKGNSITAEKRDFSKNPRQIRALGKIPATVYGHGFNSISVQVDLKAFLNAYKDDKTSILNLKVDNEIYSVLVKNIQNHITDDIIQNIEFYRVNTDEKLKVRIPVEFVGEAPAVKVNNGILRTHLTEIEVECLPGNIPTTIKVDISGLVELEDSITIGEVVYSTGVDPIATPDTVIVKINTPRTEQAASTESAEVAQLS